MYKVFDFTCTNLICPQYNKSKEFLIKSNYESITCDDCAQVLLIQLGATKGYVIGSENPVKQ